MKLGLLLSLWLFSFSILRADFAAETITQINLVRQQAGLPALTQDPRLMAIAQEWSKKLAQRQGLRHRSILDLKNFLSEYGWRGMNENLHSSTSPCSPAFVIECWMKSPVHHENLLRPKITLAGIGVTQGTDGQTYVVFNGAF
jgi:uncharacterized protein YkwD